MSIIIESYGLEFTTLTTVKNLIPTNEIQKVEFDPNRDVIWDLPDEIRNNTKDVIISYNNSQSTRLRVRNNLELNEIRAKLLGSNQKISYDLIGVDTDFLNLA